MLQKAATAPESQEEIYKNLMRDMTVQFYPSAKMFAQDSLRYYLLDMKFSPSSKKLTPDMKEQTFVKGVEGVRQLTNAHFGILLSDDEITEVIANVMDNLKQTDLKTLFQEYHSNIAQSEQSDLLKAKLNNYALTAEEMFIVRDAEKLRKILMSDFPLTEADLKDLIANEIENRRTNQQQSAKNTNRLRI